MPQTPQYQLGFHAGRTSMMLQVARLQVLEHAARARSVGFQSTINDLTTERDGLQSDLDDLQLAFDALQAEFDAYKATHP